MKSVSSQAVTIADKWCARRRGHQSTYWPQLHFVANVVVYVKHLQKLTARAPNAKSDAPKPLSESVPLFGPRFIPPNALWESSKRGPAADVTPESLYLKPVTVIHPFYFRGLCHCPNDLSTEPSERHDFKWDGWTTMGPQEVHGVWHEEMAIGLQLRCFTCREAENGSAEDQHCFASTSAAFWRDVQHWEIPRKSVSPNL